ncbi:MAG: polyribonucleotide nucleotidyltransferase [Spirochaetales bacterium]|nr:polyribonucleotide nucleotidyltransferase [Spirochaetales bacterium]
METFKFKIGEDEIILETGKMAKQANGSVLARCGGSAVMATVCCGSESVEGLDYVPLSVDYNERYYAAGKIPGGFLKREARPKDKEILVSRLIDRPMRPLFYKDFGREIQVVPMTVSTDQVHTPDVLGMIAAFAAVMISDIPFNGPVAAVRVASIKGEYVINPTFAQIEESELDIIVAASNDGICMVEGGAKEVSEDMMLGAIQAAEKTLADLCDFLADMAAKCGKEKLPLVEKTLKLDKWDDMYAEAYPRMEEAVFMDGKFERRDAIKAIKKEMLEKYAEEIPEEQVKLVGDLFEELERVIIRKSIIEKNVRCDKRPSDMIRDISCEIDTLDRAHGSALFTRGETQSLGVTTLGSVQDEQIMDDIDGDRRVNFMLHYNFPPYSVGETGRLGTGRREIGHGHLAQRAIEGVLPSKEDFPYTIRVVSEILESNGSSSQATICSGSLSLLDAGVPLKKPVAGIAMGLIKEGDDFVVLSDILGEEDHMGDMDFKVAGSEEGITAFQMDIKIPGISIDIMKKALAQALEGRLHILGIMNETIKEPNPNVSEFAPSVTSFKVDVDKIGLLIGPGGKNIKGMSEKSGAKINIDEDGTVSIFCREKKGTDLAEAMIKGMIEEPEVGHVYKATVKRIMDFGAFMEFLPGKEGLCHISKLSKERVNNVSDVLKEGDEVDVRLIEVDRMGRINLSIVDAQNPDWKPRGGAGGGRR